MKVTRMITYEHDDPDVLRRQLARSLPDGERPGGLTLAKITVETVGTDLPTYGELLKKLEGK